MNGVQGQASAEYAGLLALAAAVGATLALVAGPPLVHAMRDAFVAALSTQSAAPPLRAASAADISDVQSALVAGDGSLSPDAALIALARRHRTDEVRAISGAVLLEAARSVVPWVGRERTYRAWIYPGDGPFLPLDAATGNHDVEIPTGPPVVTWVTVSMQRRALANVLDPGIEKLKLAFDLAAALPAAPLGRAVTRTGIGALTRAVLEEAPRAISIGSEAEEALTVVSDDADGHGVPAGMRPGDVVVTWHVRRTFVRAGPPVEPVGMEMGVGSFLAPSAYSHTVILRPTEAGLQVVAEGGP